MVLLKGEDKVVVFVFLTTTTTNRPFSPFFEVVFVVTHWGVSFAHSSLPNANPKLP